MHGSRGQTPREMCHEKHTYTYHVLKHTQLNSTNPKPNHRHPSLLLSRLKQKKSKGSARTSHYSRAQLQFSRTPWIPVIHRSNHHSASAESGKPCKESTPQKRVCLGSHTLILPLRSPVFPFAVTFNMDEPCELYAGNKPYPLSCGIERLGRDSWNGSRAQTARAK